METFLIVFCIVLFFIVLLLAVALILALVRARPQTQTGQEMLSAIQQTQSQLGNLGQALASLNGFVAARKEVDEKTAEAVGRLEMIIAGSSTKGQAGEAIIEEMFDRLPPEWQVRNFAYEGRICEFAVRLPNGQLLPVDSKFPGTRALEEFLRTDDLPTKKRLKAEIEKAVLQKSKEVVKYISPGVTTPFGICVVPDSAFELASGVQAEAIQFKVAILSYSLFLPYLLLVLQMSLKARNIDTENLDTCLQDVQKALEAIREDLSGRFSKALTMLANFREDTQVIIGKANGSIASLYTDTQAGSPTPPEPGRAKAEAG
jgi:DNA recombination protein RmuC